MTLPTTMPVPSGLMGDTPQAHDALQRVRALTIAARARRTYDTTTNTLRPQHTLFTTGR